MKTLENLWQSSKILGKFGIGPKVFFRCIYDFLKLSEKLRKPSDVFGKLRKRLKSVFQMFLRFFKIFGKSSEIFRSVHKSSENHRNCS